MFAKRKLYWTISSKFEILCTAYLQIHVSARCYKIPLIFLVNYYFITLSVSPYEIPDLLNWNNLLKTETNFKNIGEKMNEEYWFIPEIWACKVFEKGLLPGFGIIVISKKSSPVKFKFSYNTSHSTTFFSQRLYASLTLQCGSW